MDGDHGGEPTFDLEELSFRVTSMQDPSSPAVIRSSVLLRMWLAVFWLFGNERGLVV